MMTKKIDLWTHQENWVVGQALQILEAYDQACGTLMCEFGARELCRPQNSLYLIIKFSDGLFW